MSRDPRQDESAAVRRDLERFNALKGQLATLDFFVRGSLVNVRVRCGRRGCSCATDPDARHGPYVRWTRKVAGKTVSVALRSDEVPVFEQWIANSRRLDDIIEKMQELGLRAVARKLKARTKT